MNALKRSLRLPAPRRQFARLVHDADSALERLEDRTLLASTVIVEPINELELVGRDRWGNWWASNPSSTSGVLEHRIVATWDPIVDWQHVLTGDFNWDGWDDIAGWDPSSGVWFVTLSGPTGSSTLAAGAWSNATTWSDVAVADVKWDGKPNDLVGRDQWGNWWAALANDDGTFRNALLTNWNPDAGWQDVRFFDANGDSTVDIVGRDRWGNWWASENLARLPNVSGLQFSNRFLTSWSATAGWQDATVLGGFDGARNGLAARAFDGGWWAWSVGDDGSVDTQFLMAWNESAGWRDVVAANMVGGATWGSFGTPAEEYLYPPSPPEQDIVGRTAAGEWYALDPRKRTTNLIGKWNEAAGWRDVQVVTVRSFSSYHVYGWTTFADTLIGRTADGEWFSSSTNGDGEYVPLMHTRLGSWNEAGGWHDVFAAANMGYADSTAESAPSMAGSAETSSLEMPRSAAVGLTSISERVPFAAQVMVEPSMTLHRSDAVAVDEVINDFFADELPPDGVANRRESEAWPHVLNEAMDTLLLRGDGLDIPLGDFAARLAQSS